MPLQGPSILVVDDNPETLETICWMAKNMHVGEVCGFTSVDEAMGYIQGGGETQLILCDWNMPEKSGLDMLKILRAQGNLTPFIMVTARNDVNSVLEARKHGVDLYISKPFSSEELQQKVHWITSHKQDLLKSHTFSDSSAT